MGSDRPGLHIQTLDLDNHGRKKFGHQYVSVLKYVEICNCSRENVLYTHVKKKLSDRSEEIRGYLEIWEV